MAKKKKGIYEGFYSVESLINSLDRNNEVAIMHISVSATRSLGKTFSICKYLYNFHKNTGRKFCLLVRQKSECISKSVANGVFKGFLDVEHPTEWIQETTGQTGVFNFINLCSIDGEDDDGEPVIKSENIGYTICLKAFNQIKSVSSTFVDADWIFFDEFQPNDGKYLHVGDFDEPAMLLNIYQSIARGGGQRQRKIRIIFASNTINIFNPYFIALGLHKQIQPNTRFYKGDGFVYEKCEVKGAAESDKKQGLNKLFSDYLNLDQKDDNSWLADSSQACVNKPKGWGRCYCLANIKDGSNVYGVKYYPEVGFYYLDRTPEQNMETFNMRLGSDLNIAFIKSSPFFKKLKSSFLAGSVRCKDGGVLSSVLDLFNAK